MDKEWIDEVLSQEYDWYDIVPKLSQTKDIDLDDLRKLSQYGDSRLLAHLIRHPLISEDLIVEISNRIVPEMHIVYEATVSSPLCPKDLRMKILGTGTKIWEHLDDKEILRRINVLEALWPTDKNNVRIQDALVYVYLKQGRISEARELAGVEEPTGKFIEKGVWDWGASKPKKVKFPKEIELHELCRNPLTPPELIYQLTYVDDDYHEQAIACNPGAPLIALDYYASSSLSGNLMSLVFSNPSLPGYLFDQGLAEQVSGQYEQIIYGEMAANIAIPNSVIQVLSKHKNPDVLNSLAQNPVFPNNTALSESETNEIMEISAKYSEAFAASLEDLD